MRSKVIYGQILNFKNHKVAGEYVHDILSNYTAVRWSDGKARRINGSFSYFAEIYLNNMNRNYDITASRASVEF